MKRWEHFNLIAGLCEDADKQAASMLVVHVVHNGDTGDLNERFESYRKWLEEEM